MSALFIDAASLIFRAHLALPEILGRRGEPVQGVLGFANMLQRALDDTGAELVSVCFDAGTSGREEAYADYKAERQGEPPEEIALQFIYVARLLEALRCQALFAPGFEADDVIATAVRQAEAAGFSSLILTGDRDLFGCISPETTVLYTRRGVTDLDAVGPDAFRERFGIEPEQYADWKALVGDSSDHIPGVRGLGPKAATRLVAACGGLEGALRPGAAAAVLGPRLAGLLLAEADAVRLWRRLAALRLDAPVRWTAADARFDWSRADAAGVAALLEELGLRQLAARLGKRITGDPR